MKLNHYKQQVAMLQAENTRLRKSLGDAVEILTKLEQSVDAIRVAISSCIQVMKAATIPEEVFRLMAMLQNFFDELARQIGASLGHRNQVKGSA